MKNVKRTRSLLSVKLLYHNALSEQLSELFSDFRGLFLWEKNIRSMSELRMVKEKSRSSEFYFVGKVYRSYSLER